jgi:hypothetical protein
VYLTYSTTAPGVEVAGQARAACRSSRKPHHAAADTAA